MDSFPLFSIPILYFFVAFLKPLVQPKLPFNLCSICVAVSLTWCILLLFWILGNPISLMTLGILMGMSVTGIMYKMEAFYKEKHIRNFWFVRLIVIVGGYFGVYLFLDKELFLFSFIAFLSFFLIVIPTFLFQGVTHAEALREVKGKKSLIQKLEDCC